MDTARKVIIRETAPRDGWQNLEFIDTDMKFKVIEKIIDMGVQEMELTSFVSPKAVPQTRDAAELSKMVIDAVNSREKNVKLTALIPNKKGAENAYAAGIKTVDFVMSASEEHNKRNVKRTIEESFDALQDILSSAPDDFEVRLGFACVYGSPFGDKIDIDNVIRIIEKSLNMGVKLIGIADSAGVSTPDHTAEITRKIKQNVDLDKLTAHIHDTRGLGIANTYAAFQEGIYRFDSALGGLGGCPFIPGAAGNISSEDIITMFDRMGVETGIDMDKMIEASLFLAANINGKYNSKILDINKLNF
jgi:hydroxymethylglutaryl-CoA lyase